jgi:hypothetical protein
VVDADLFNEIVDMVDKVFDVDIGRDGGEAFANDGIYAFAKGSQVGLIFCAFSFGQSLYGGRGS